MQPVPSIQGVFWEDIQNFPASQEALDQRTVMLGLSDSQGPTLTAETCLWSLFSSGLLPERKWWRCK